MLIIGCPSPITTPKIWKSVNQKIYIADPQNQRLIKMDDMSGSGWQEYSNRLLGSIKPQYPNFITFHGGFVWIFDAWNYRVLRMDDLTGAGCIGFGSWGAGLNQFRQASTIAFDSSNRIYVADDWGHRIERFDDMDGTNWITFGEGTMGSEMYQFSHPRDVAVDQTTGDIYIADEGNDRVVKTDKNMTTAWEVLTGNGSGDIFSSPSKIVLYEGKIYVMESTRIIRMDDFTGAGWTVCTGNGTINFGNLQSMFIASNGQIYLLDATHMVIRIDGIDATGIATGWTTFGEIGYGDGRFAGFASISLDTSGSIYVTDTGKRCVTKFNDMTGSGWDTYLNSIAFPMFIAHDSQKRIYITDGFKDPDTQNGMTYRIVRMDDITGRNFITFGTVDGGPFSSCSGIAVDINDKIYISDAGYNSIVRIDDMSGANFSAYGTVGSGIGNFKFPMGIDVADDGKIYIADIQNHRIVKIDDMFGSGWATFGSGPGSNANEFNFPYSIRITEDNKFLVIDAGNFRIVRFDNMLGTNWTTYGSQGGGPGQFQGPVGISVDADGRIYITDIPLHRVVRMDGITGSNWTTFGGNGAGTGQFNLPIGIDVF
jgi:DNA-binding beta-propeller fold protein YncE